MVRKTAILFAKDFASSAEPALGHAAALAREGKACLHLLYVFDYGGDSTQSSERQARSVEAIEDSVRALTLAEMARDIERAGAQDLTIVRTLRCGHPVEAVILRHAELIEADLIVRAKHDHQRVVEPLPAV